MKTRCIIFLCATLLLATPYSVSSQESNQLVLVTSIATNLTPLTPLEIRQLFLGIPVYRDDRRISPILNRSSRLAYEVFLQKAMFLSATSYEKQLVRRVFQTGGTRPLEVDDHDELGPSLLNIDNSIAYMWASEANQNNNLKIVQTIWRGESD